MSRGLSTLALLIPFSCFGAEDGTLENLDTLVRTYAAAKSPDGAWTVRRKKGPPVRLVYASLQERSARDLGNGTWGAVADFTEEGASKIYHAGVVANMGAGTWEVTSFRWLTAKELPAFRAELAGRAESFARAHEGPDAPVGKPRPSDAEAPPPPMNPGEKPAAARTRDAAALAATLAANEKAFYDPKRDARKDLTAALDLARRSRKRVLLIAGHSGCGWCKKLGALFRGDDELRRLRDKAFVTVHADFASNATWLREYAPIQGTPHFLVLNSEGELLQSQDTGALESGSQYDRGRLASFLGEWQP
jgi:hypothetical protein